MIRAANVNDAPAYRTLIQSLEAETDYLLFGKGERKWSVEQVEELLEKLEQAETSIIFLSEEEEEILGHVTVLGGGAPRNGHVGNVITGVLQKKKGTGMATKLFNHLFKWALEVGITRLELTVMVHNERAIRFYERMGFEKEGVKRNSLVVRGTPVDEYMMAKILV
ncbi:Protein N-acetyltransferase, RimJ/RimL family [Halobacillus dabanensis]|uniref:Protein N-acetyltransferase, RimJ/RimL family n=1 Tax=Halobacillus dabanensis TaxID=240302 RepID=A0A1I3SS86_HALDA|nr:GNAT family protein [Halobacillus dabanensis]SFJ61638.1 Protein N-acetyltransferase, RimJ/RimL family [Halobacillus dabanensis]